MIEIWTTFIILQGVLAPADNGVLEDVANRRATLFQQVENWREYEVLTAVEDCHLLGRSGWLITDKIRTAIVIDCEADVHRGQMRERGLMADTTLDETGVGYLVLR